MKIAATFLIVFIRFTNCLNYSADHVDLILFGSSVDDRTIVRASEPEKILIQERFNPLLKTVFIIPGVPAEIDDILLSTFVQNYINSKRYNVIYFDGGYYLNDLSGPGIFDEVMWWASELYGSIISKLITSGLSVDSIELIGHSWGCGAAYLAANNTIQKLPLLIGLDPLHVQEFRKGIADYTIALHTNVGLAGQLPFRLSDSDLIANNGIIQPVCTDRKLQEIESAQELMDIAQCSHIAALYYWGSMIDKPQLFYGVECNETECNYENIQQLGPNLRTPGTFYFKTSKTSPFGLGLDGIKNISPMDQNVLNRLQVWLPIWDYILFCKEGYCSPQQKLEMINLLKLNW